jgi:hypothetical protein
MPGETPSRERARLVNVVRTIRASRYPAAALATRCADAEALLARACGTLFDGYCSDAPATWRTPSVVVEG